MTQTVRRPRLANFVDGDPTPTDHGAVYSLVDPRNQAVRYIGQTITPLVSRLAGHMGSKNPGVRAWVRELKQLGLAPIIRLVRHVPLVELDAAERQAIADHAWDGWSLLNLTGIPEPAAKDPEVAAARARRARSGSIAARDWAEAERRRVVEDGLKAADRAGAFAALFAVAQRVSGGPLPPPLDMLQAAGNPDIPAPVRRFMTSDYVGTSPDVRHSDYVPAREFILNLAGQSRQYVAMELIEDLADRGRQVQQYGSQDAVPQYLRRYVDAKWEQPADALRVLSWAAWHTLMVVPWRLFAEAADLPTTGPGFANIVTDDPDVRNAIVAWDSSPWRPKRPERRDIASPESLAATLVPYATGDLQMVGDHAARAIDLGVRMSEMARVNGLTQSGVDMFTRIDPHAMERTLGRDVLGEVEASMVKSGHAPGAGRAAIRALLRAQRTRSRSTQAQRWSHADYLEEILKPRSIPVGSSPFYKSGIMSTPSGDHILAAFVTLIVRGVTSVPEQDADLIRWIEREMA